MAKRHVIFFLSTYHHHPPPPPPPQQQQQSPSSYKKMSLPSNSSLPSETIKPEDSDEELFAVPDAESGPDSSGKAGGGVLEVTGSRRGRNPADREYRQHKRLLRNRVSAQEARERKKVYVNDMESRARKLHDENLKLEEKITTLINENTVLRKVLMSTRSKLDQNQHNDQCGNS